MDETDIANPYGGIQIVAHLNNISTNTSIYIPEILIPIVDVGSNSDTSPSDGNLTNIDDVMSSGAVDDLADSMMSNLMDTHHQMDKHSSVIIREQIEEQIEDSMAQQNISHMTGSDDNSNMFVRIKPIYSGSFSMSNISGRCFTYNDNTSDSMLMLSYKLATLLIVIIAVLGLIFNSFGIVLFSSKRIKRTSTRVYLLWLAISDLFYLVVVILTRGLDGLKCVYFPNSDIDIYNSHDVPCRGLQYLLDIFSDFSTCLILVFTVERFLACYFATTYRHKCHPRSATTVLVILISVISATILPHHLLFMEYNKEKEICTVSEKYILPFTYLYITETTLYRIIPTYLVAIFNTAIIKKIWQLSSIQKTGSIRSTASSFAFSQGNNNNSSNINFYENSTELTVTKPAAEDTISARVKFDKENSTKISLMLVIISTFYLLCYQPVLICYILMKISGHGYSDIPRNTLLIFKNYSRVLYILGRSVNFFFYTLASKEFRKELKVLLCMSFSGAKRILHRTH